MPTVPSIRTSIENQSVLILDEHAKNGVFNRTARGGLVAYTGGFSVVFPYETANKEKWAFRCWHANIDNSKRRYEVIAEAIKNSGLDFLCDFEYVDRGINVDGKIYPTTRMRWVDGLTIKDFICKNVGSKDLLKGIAEKFLELVRNLHNLSFAHGDLQHGNILVDKNNQLYLVDYDSFYCPKLKGKRDIITGLADYQHPSRKINSFVNEKLDYFSELVIYTSILAIAEQPSLIVKYKVNDSERLLFAASDFIDIKNSAIYADLQQLSPIINKLLDILCIYLSKDSINELEPFDVILDRMTKLPEIHYFKCFPEVCLKGDNVILKWSVENYTQILLNGEDVTSADSIEITDVTEPDYTLTVHNYQKRVTSSIKLDILPRPVITFQADKQKLHAGKGESVTLSWNVKNAEKCSLIGQEGTKDNIKNHGTLELTPNKTTTYTLRVLALDKRTTVDTPLTIEVFPDAIVEYKTDKEYVFPSIPFTLSWEVQHAKLVELDGVAVKDSDSITYIDGVDKETTYILRVTDEFGIKEYHKRIKMLPIPQVKAILVPTPHINEKINVAVNIPTPVIDIRLPQYRIEECEPLDLNIFNIGIDTSAVRIPETITPKFNIKEPNFWKRMYDYITKKLKHHEK